MNDTVNGEYTRRSPGIGMSTRGVGIIILPANVSPGMDALCKKKLSRGAFCSTNLKFRGERKFLFVGVFVNALIVGSFLLFMLGKKREDPKVLSISL
jgi:hypothetical protein